MNNKLKYFLIAVGVILFIWGCISLNKSKGNSTNSTSNSNGGNGSNSNSASSSTTRTIQNQDTSICNATKIINGVTYKIYSVHVDKNKIWNADYTSTGKDSKSFPITEDYGKNYLKYCSGNH